MQLLGDCQLNDVAGLLQSLPQKSGQHPLRTPGLAFQFPQDFVAFSFSWVGSFLEDKELVEDADAAAVDETLD